MHEPSRWIALSPEHWDETGTAFRPQLLLHGVRPTRDTNPELVYGFVNDLYRYELRRLRHALVSGAIPKVGYYDRVVDLRRKYPLVSFKPHLWVE